MVRGMNNWYTEGKHLLPAVLPLEMAAEKLALATVVKVPISAMLVSARSTTDRMPLEKANGE